MRTNYLKLIKEADKISKTFDLDDIKNQITNVVANADSKTLFNDLRKFVDEMITNYDLKIELLDTIEFCESEKADAESTLIKLKIVIDNHEGDNAMKESIMTPSTGSYPNNRIPRNEIEKVRALVILDKNDNPMLTKGGAIISNLIDDAEIQNKVNDLYRLIRNAKSIYVIEDDDYNKCIDINNRKDYVKFIKDNGRLIKSTLDKDDIIDTLDTDTADDFLLDVVPMDNTFVKKESRQRRRKSIDRDFLIDEAIVNPRLPHGPYWYFTTHGVMPGSVPKDIEIYDMVDGEGHKRKARGTYFAADKILTTQELNDFDIVEDVPDDDFAIDNVKKTVDKYYGKGR